jgi:hypothetical protein
MATLIATNQADVFAQVNSIPRDVKSMEFRTINMSASELSRASLLLSRPSRQSGRKLKAK